jgi:hypothetical protein
MTHVTTKDLVGRLEERLNGAAAMNKERHKTMMETMSRIEKHAAATNGSVIAVEDKVASLEINTSQAMSDLRGSHSSLKAKVELLTKITIGLAVAGAGGLGGGFGIERLMG